MMEGDTYIKLRITPELLEKLFTRDKDGNKLELIIGEPDNDGFYTPVVTIHYDDNPFAKVIQAAKEYHSGRSRTVDEWREAEAKLLAALAERDTP